MRVIAAGNGPWGSIRWWAKAASLRFLRSRRSWRSASDKIGKGDARRALRGRLRCALDPTVRFGTRGISELSAGGMRGFAGDGQGCLETLRGQLEDAVAHENYELAAQVRDQIKELEAEETGTT